MVSVWEPRFSFNLGLILDGFLVPQMQRFRMFSNKFAMLVLKRALKSSKKASKVVVHALTLGVWGPGASLGGGGE